jgi:hypothetical protein
MRRAASLAAIPLMIVVLPVLTSEPAGVDAAGPWRTSASEKLLTSDQSPQIIMFTPLP